ncbi:glycosyltransferase family 2 protein [Cyclobacterium salsum]|uniref:glycosyltransferase family 2 protein n=1 Tax=Cyclobacterium salsum TaxID=2666329 RepID=UPI0013907F96|nr:glycosyltransferase [Cyclobacterium salsum]
MLTTKISTFYIKPLLSIELQPQIQIKTVLPHTKVSVVIPNLNRKSELIRAIQSVLNQTYKALEIIIVDDGSDFSNKEYLEANGFCGDLIKVFRNPVNKGLSYSRNRGISLAKGDFIAFLDSDDFWEPEKIQRQVQLFQSNPCLDMVYCDTYLLVNNKRVIRDTIFYDAEIWSHLMTGWKPTNPSTLMVKKNSFLKIGYFDETLRHHEDFDFWLRAADKLKIGYCTEILSNFSFDSEDRLSNEYKLKFERTRVFLEKWADKIVAKNGRMEFKKFKDDLISRMAVETFNSALRFRKYQNLLGVFFNYLIFDKRFLRLLMSKLKIIQ